MKLTQTQRAVKHLKKEVVCDSIANRKGVIILKRSFFYRHGGSAEKLEKRVVQTLTEAGFKIRDVKSQEHWNNWPVTSYWEVRVQIEDSEA
jgi:hypothetical protein